MENNKELSRRGFLKGSALLGAGLTSAGLLAACTTGANEQGSRPPANAADIAWDKETDVIVVGFGGAGGAAAIEAGMAGAEVTVLEMTSNGGGSTAINGGFVMMGGTALQEELGIEDSVEEFSKYLIAAAGGSGNPEAWDFMAKGAPDLYQWCLDVGMTFDKTVDFGKVGGGRPGLGLAYSGNERARQFEAIAKPAPRGHIVSPEGNGQGFFRPLKAKVEELGCEVLYDTTAEHLVQDADGRVIGVIAQDVGGGQLNIKARRGVCMTGGGFGLNEDMMQANFIQDVRPAFPTAAPCEQGLGIIMGLEIGAATYGLGQFAMGRAMYGSGEDEYVAPLKGIYVNPAGRRMVAEDEYYAFVGRQIIYAHDAWLIVDDTVNAEINEALIGPPVASAQTMETLAAAIGLPPLSLSSTLNDYNIGANKGEDPEFGKHEEYIVPLVTAPFHAYNMGPGGCYYHTCGGLKINLDAQVLDQFGQPIPGLFAGGRNSNIAFGQYVGSGSAMLDVFTFGRIAGQNAAAESPVA